ncbi:uncharacterized protein LOC130123269 isoform X2 [Lampris incognitus]|uniref:uncharacterized protein LOC130123269 isoform X2 n=1 Tax=Lampris incognitus TaxID=2546036 RepID=UPI0024B59924|nr:uncharacterized protein LOC130123269 isoform X2 [Lampris incognitus]
MNLLRSFVVERLTAAAEEILGAFERTLQEREKEIDRQRRLLDIILKPSVTLHRTEIGTGFYDGSYDGSCNTDGEEDYLESGYQ